MSRHRQAFLVWAAVLPTLTVLQLVLGGALADVPPLLRPPIMATLAVPVVVYLLMPALAKRFARD
ncbi:hypothetical protein [Yinghuangia seranimata]|uniref:hypothetical protein n=1 Tax=Yinghuangia seranimata TaxID=408067 RepID=UPI00248A95C0|nr:hypothetical protein [Yinghuangia seranimata]MDI2127639.1 hypothetical protein [Yinghuangia seranimata]